MYKTFPSNTILTRSGNFSFQKVMCIGHQRAMEASTKLRKKSVTDSWTNLVLHKFYLNNHQLLHYRQDRSIYTQVEKRKDKMDKVWNQNSTLFVLTHMHSCTRKNLPFFFFSFLCLIWKHSREERCVAGKPFKLEENIIRKKWLRRKERTLLCIFSISLPHNHRRFLNAFPAAS